jgi:uncharacterized damage-inducible protein DinB
MFDIPAIENIPNSLSDKENTLMAENTITLASLYKGWDIYQGHLVKAIAPLTSEQLALSIAPNLRTIGQIAAHIVFARAGWMHKAMGEGGQEIAEIARWDWACTGHTDNAVDLVQALEVTWREIQSCLERWTLEDLGHVFKGERFGKSYEFTRQWVIWHLIEHDMHHGGELSFVLGSQGLAAPDL